MRHITPATDGELVEGLTYCRPCQYSLFHSCKAHGPTVQEIEARERTWILESVGSDDTVGISFDHDVPPADCLPLVMLYWAYANVRELMPRRKVSSTDPFVASLRLTEIEDKMQKFIKDGDPLGIVFTPAEIYAARYLQRVCAEVQYQ